MKMSGETYVISILQIDDKWSNIEYFICSQPEDVANLCNCFFYRPLLVVPRITFD